jgi:tripartite-type tricarboxylate transporter receptor subunit TctC
VPVTIDNQPGRAGTTGLALVAQAGDGHTLGIAESPALSLAPLLFRLPPYDAARALRLVLPLASQSLVLACGGSRVPAATLAEFVAWAKARAAPVEYASSGDGSLSQLAMAGWLAEVGLVGRRQPFADPGAAARALAEGQVEAACLPSPVLIASHRSGRVRALAMSSSLKDDSLPGLPTLATASYDAPAWLGLVAVASMPEAALKRINTECNALLQDPNVKLVMELRGLTPLGGGAAELQRLIDADRRRWAPLISRLGLRLEGPAAAPR